MRQVTIKVQRTYIKEAEVTLDLPDNIVLDYVDDYLRLYPYEDKIQKLMDKQEHSFLDEHIRYDVIAEVTEVKHIWGGTL